MYGNEVMIASTALAGIWKIFIRYKFCDASCSTVNGILWYGICMWTSAIKHQNKTPFNDIWCSIVSMTTRSSRRRLFYGPGVVSRSLQLGLVPHFIRRLYCMLVTRRLHYALPLLWSGQGTCSQMELHSFWLCLCQHCYGWNIAWYPRQYWANFQ